MRPRRKMPRRSRIIKLVGLAAIAIVGVTLVVYIGLFVFSFFQPSVQIELVFPDNFRGLARLRGEQEGGTDVQRQGGAYVLVFPSSGVLEIKGKLPTMRWHVVSARFASGTVIRGADSDPSVGKDDIALRQVGLFENREDWFVVGTDADLAKAYEQKRGFKWP